MRALELPGSSYYAHIETRREHAHRGPAEPIIAPWLTWTLAPYPELAGATGGLPLAPLAGALGLPHL